MAGFGLVSVVSMPMQEARISYAGSLGGPGHINPGAAAILVNAESRRVHWRLAATVPPFRVSDVVRRW
jgi:hypothetical protein